MTRLQLTTERQEGERLFSTGASLAIEAGYQAVLASTRPQERYRAVAASTVPADRPRLRVEGLNRISSGNPPYERAT